MEKNKVNHPEHYQGEHECIEVMEKLYGIEAVKDFCRCNSFKYRFRAGSKEGESREKDIKKAEWYENRLFEYDKTDDVTDWTDEEIERGLI